MWQREAVNSANNWQRLAESTKKWKHGVVEGFEKKSGKKRQKMANCNRVSNTEQEQQSGKFRQSRNL